jgi:UDP-N-acetylbacillosamine N-acetyltransferase
MTPVPRGLVVLGFGGHARSVADIALALGIEELIFVDETAAPNESLWGFPVQKAFDDRLPDGWQTFAASGDNQARHAQVTTIRERCWPLATLVSPTATIGTGAIMPTSGRCQASARAASSTAAP